MWLKDLIYFVCGAVLDSISYSKYVLTFSKRFAIFLFQMNSQQKLREWQKQTVKQPKPR